MADLLIFDGDCGICTFFSEFVQKRSSANKLQIKPYQILNLSEIHQDLDELKTSQSLYLVTEDKVLYNRSKGVFEVMKRMNGIYKLIGFILSNPIAVVLFNPIYKWIAKNRTKISSKLGLNACNIRKYS